MIEAFIREAIIVRVMNGWPPAHRSSIRAIPSSGQLSTFREPNRSYERGSIVPKPPRSVAHVAYWKEESEAK